MNTHSQKNLLDWFSRISSILMIIALLFAAAGVKPANAAPLAAGLPGWANKTPITIANSGGALTDYQVQINLDPGNFDFGQANSDGSDIRFAAADGTTLLPFWQGNLECRHECHLLGKTTSLPAGGSITIYLYFGNPSAASASDGASTFYFYDGFEAPPWTGMDKGGRPGHI